MMSELLKLRGLFRERDALRERLRRVDARIVTLLRADVAVARTTRGKGRTRRTAARASRRG